MAQQQYTNIHGRKWGRGLRPWLLLPKYVCISLILGGVAAIAVLGFVAGDDSQSANLAQAILYYQVFPALGGATLLGLALLWHHGPVMFKMRWLWAKLAAVVVAGALLHLLLKKQILLQQQTPPGKVGIAAIIVMAAFILVAVLGRLKPRLWQPFVKK